MKGIFVVLQRDIRARLYHCWAKSLVTVQYHGPNTFHHFPSELVKMRTVSDSSAVVSDSSLAELPYESLVES